MICSPGMACVWSAHRTTHSRGIIHMMAPLELCSAAALS